jgi:Concanavalin A-like lectin/glucanases superfamily
MSKNKFQFLFTGLALAMLFFSACQKISKPALGDYPKDNNPPGGPLKFYVAFDGTTSNPLMNAVDSIRANFASDNPLASTDGVRGKGVQGAPKKFIKYASFNDWSTSSSFSVSVWFKKNGQTTNNLGTNGPEYIFSLRAKKKDEQNDYHWSNAVMFLFLEGNNTGCAVKAMCVSPSVASNPNSSPSDNWFTWENAQTIPGLLNDQWHHMVVVYDAATSTMKLYIDGVANPNVKSWNNHGAIRLSQSFISEYRVGRGPRNDNEGDGEGGWLQSSFKGKMDQLRFYGTALTAAEVTNLFTNKL